MEIVIFLLLIVFLLVYRSASDAHRHSLNKMQEKIDRLLVEMRHLREELRATPGQAPHTITAPEVIPVVPPQAAMPPPPQPIPVPPPVRSAAPIPTPQQAAASPTNAQRREVPAPQLQPMHQVRESWMDKWLRNNPDLEKFIGENLVNKIGIAVLVLGIAFFVKYAIDQNWINEVGRVCIGLLCGAVLTGLAHYLRNGYRSFSSVLAGGGLAVFYFTIAFAFHQYELLSQTAAFLIMVVITGFAIALSVLYNKVELAVIAAVGGFLTPFMVSTGEGNYIVLFTYLLILNSGLLALAFFKRWPLLNVLALFFTEIIFAGWLVKTWWEEAPKVSYPIALMFATAFYLLFLGMNMVHQVKHRQAFKAFDFSILLLLNGSYFAAGMLLLEPVYAGRFQGLFTLAAGVINLVLARYFFRRTQADKNLVYLLIGLTLTFLTLTIPVQLKGHAITIFWSAEFVLLFWLYQRSRIRLFFLSSLLIATLALISLMMDWYDAGLAPANLVLIYTNLQGLATNIVAVAAFATYRWLLQKERESLPFGVERVYLRQASILLAIVLAYLTAVYGVNLVFRDATAYHIPNVYHRLVTAVGIAAVLIWLRMKAGRQYSWPLAGALCGYLIYHLFSIPMIVGLRNGVLEGSNAAVHLAMHWVSVGAVLCLVYATIQMLRQTAVPYFSATRLSWIISILMLFFFGQEAGHLFIAIGHKANNVDYLEGQYAKAVLTIVWALCSFGLMWMGMKYKNKTLRIISLSVFSIALVKLFFYDIANVSEGGKIVAFILLGVLLLTVSFMYQKLKKMIMDDVKE